MIYIDRSSKIPIYRQIYEQIRGDIIDGTLGEGSRLMSIRSLANNICVARNTVEYAYAQLSLEGYVQNKACSGFVVQKIDRSFFTNAHSKIDDKLLHYSSSSIPCNSNVGLPGDMLAWINNELGLYEYDFQCTGITREVFPHAIWRKLTNETLRANDNYKIGIYNDMQGEADLRNEIMLYLNRSRDVHCTADQIVMCSGIRNALDIVCKLLSDRVERFAVEEPTNYCTRAVIENSVYKIAPVVVNEDGISIRELKRSSADAVFVTPSHQFPTGVVMSIQNRIQLLDWAIQNNTVVIEDDYDSELRYHTGPIPSLQSIDKHGRVIYMGTFSKALSPDLRMAYMILPEWILSKYYSMFAMYRSTLSWFQQRVLCQFMKEGYWERHIQKLCHVNRIKHDALIRTIKSLMGDRVTIRGANAGTHLILEFPGGEEQKWLTSRAKEFGVKVYPITPFWYNKEKCPQNQLLIGFNMLDEKQIIRGVSLLNKAWFEADT